MQTSRFGKKLPVPSTAEIKHELRLMMVAETLRVASREKLADSAMTEEQTTELAESLVVRHGIGIDRAKTLVSRFGFGSASHASSVR